MMKKSHSDSRYQFLTVSQLARQLGSMDSAWQYIEDTQAPTFIQGNYQYYAVPTVEGGEER